MRVRVSRFWGVGVSPPRRGVRVASREVVVVRKILVAVAAVITLGAAAPVAQADPIDDAVLFADKTRNWGSEWVADPQGQAEDCLNGEYLCPTLP